MIAKAPLNNNKFALNKTWSATQFNLNNPTSSNYTIDLFNAYTLSNVQTIATPTLPPTIVTTIIPSPLQPSGMAYNSINNAIYVCNEGSNNISIINCVTNTIIGVPILAGLAPKDIAYNSLNNTMYVCNGSSNDVTVIDCITNTVIGSPITVGTNPNSIAYNSLNNTMYVCNGSSNDVTVIDCITNLVVATILLVNSPNGIAYNPTNNMIYIVSTSGNIVVIDCTTNTIISLFIISLARRITYNQLHDTMYVSTGGSVVRVIDCATNTVVGSPIDVGANPHGLAYDSLNDSMYVVGAVSNDVTIIDCATNTVVGSPIDVGNQPLDVVYNNFSNSIYVSNLSSDDVYAISPSILPAFYISGSTDYNQFVREFSFMPKRVRHITMIVDNPSQLNIPYELLTRDANGISVNNPKLPNNSVKVNQYQSNMVELSFGEKELILDNTTMFNQYTVLPYSSVSMVVYYDEIDLSDALTNSVSVCQMIEPTVADGSSKTEAELEAKENLPLLDLQEIKSLRASDFIK